MSDLLLKKAFDLLLILIIVELGLILISLGRNYFAIQGEIILILLFTYPLIIYVILSGKLQSLKTPGGLELKFFESANKPLFISIGSASVTLERSESIYKGNIDLIDRIFRKINLLTPINLKIVINDNGYQLNAIRRYLKRLSNRDFKFVFFLDGENNLILFMSSRSFLDIFIDDQSADYFIRILNASNIEALKRFQGIYSDALNQTSTNIEALKKMSEKELDAYPVCDNNKQVIGIVTRENILSKMIIDSL